MATRAARRITEEWKEMVGAIVEQKLIELFGDPDEGFVISKALHDRLLRQKRAVAKGGRGERLEEVVTRLGLA